MLKEKLRSFCASNLTKLLPTKWAQTSVALVNKNYISRQKLVELSCFCIPIGFPNDAITINDLLFFEPFLNEYNVVVKDNDIHLINEHLDVILPYVNIEGVKVSESMGQYYYTIIYNGVWLEFSNKLKIR